MHCSTIIIWVKIFRKVQRHIKRHEIQSIPSILIENTSSKEDYSKHYRPIVVSIGPYHMGAEHVAPMENFKKKAVKELAERVKDKALSIEQMYASVEQDLLRARNRYHRSFECSDDQWCLMMFLDGCFIIEFIFNDTITNTSGRRSWLDMKKRDRDLVRRDLLLFENQLPFQVLDVLARAFNFPSNLVALWSLQMPLLNISSAPTPGFYEQHRQWKPQAPVHLLQFYRDLWIRILFGDDVEEEDNNEEEQAKEDGLAVCRPVSVTELKKGGIRCSCARGRRPISHLADIHLKSFKFSGKLFLPQLTIDEWTMTLLLNLVAYEYSCSLQYRSFGISSYLSFMSMLINGEEDVKELRARGVIQLNKVGDDQVVNFFKDVTAHNEPNPQAFRHVKRQISTYFKSKRRLPLKVAYAEFKQRYFSGPWSFLVFLAVVFTVGMTVVQTVWTGIQTYKKD